MPINSFVSPCLHVLVLCAALSAVCVLTGACNGNPEAERKVMLEGMFRGSKLDTGSLVRHWEMKTSALEKIEVRNDRHTSLSLGRSADSIFYVRLETNPDCLIGKIDKIYKDDHHLIIVDRALSKEVFVFDENGKFLNKIAALGGGPHQYLHLSDAGVDFVRKQVTILDEERRKLLYFGFDGQFIRSIALPLFVNYIEYPDGDTSMVWCNYDILNSHIPSLENYSLFLAEPHGRILQKAFPFDPKTNEECSYWNINVLSKSSGNIYYNPKLSDYIFKVSPDSVEACYYLDFDGRSFSGEELSHLTDEVYEKRMKEDDFLLFNGDYVINDDYVYCKILNKVKVFGCFYSKHLKKSVSFSAVNVDHPNAVLFNFPVSAYKNFFIAVLNASDIATFRDKLSNLKKSPSVVNLYKSVRPEDNPVLMFYSFKTPSKQND